MLYVRENASGRAWSTVADDVPLCRLCDAPLDPQAEHCEARAGRALFVALLIPRCSFQTLKVRASIAKTCISFPGKLLESTFELFFQSETALS